MSLGVRLFAVALCVCPLSRDCMHARRISLGGEGNALYPVFSSLFFTY